MNPHACSRDASAILDAPTYAQDVDATYVYACVSAASKRGYRLRRRITRNAEQRYCCPLGAVALMTPYVGLLGCSCSCCELETVGYLVGLRGGALDVFVNIFDTERMPETAYRYPAAAALAMSFR